jgi:acetoin utilization deacetylase AcuC-like enzyme
MHTGIPAGVFSRPREPRIIVTPYLQRCERTNLQAWSARVKLIYNPIFLEHDTGMHPENRKRLELCGDLPYTEVENGESYLTLVHTQEYIDSVKKACEDGHTHLDADTIVSEKSYDAAVYAVGATLMAARQNDFALVRPPGHHAFASHSSGFCIFNNIAIAVQQLVNEGNRVLIFDFDAHLGDGTVQFFAESDKVLYWSLHQYPAFPGGGDMGYIGEGKGEGYTINTALPPGAGDEIFLDAVDRLMPVAEQFAPDVVAVSAGFDAHQYDLLLQLRLSMNAYHAIGVRLRERFDTIFATLEGGYNVEVFPKCLYNFLDGINGDELRYTERATDSMIQTVDEFEGRMALTEQKLRKHWNI